MPVLPSTNMNLPIPSVGTEPGPQYATDLNSCLGIIDQHDHSSGSGVKVTPDGLDINADLDVGGNGLVDVSILSLTPQGSVGTTDSLGVIGVDLYFKDGSGNSIRMTQSGGIAGSPGSITGLTSPASASYNSGTSTFTFQSASTTAAILDGASVTIRKLTASSAGITLTAPASLASDYTLTLPALPASQKIMTLDASGNITAPYEVDGSSIVISSNTIQLGTGAALANLASGSVTPAKLAQNNIVISSGCGNYFPAGTYGTYQQVTNLSISITTTGKKVRLYFVQETVASEATLTALPYPSGFYASSGTCVGKFVKNGTDMNFFLFPTIASGSAGYLVPQYIDAPAAGTYTYSVSVRGLTNSYQPVVNYLRLVAEEM